MEQCGLHEIKLVLWVGTNRYTVSQKGAFELNVFMIPFFLSTFVMSVLEYSRSTKKKKKTLAACH